MVAIACNIVMSLVFINFLQHTGLALAIALAAWINAGLLAFRLWQEKIYLPAAGWWLYLMKIALAVTGMAATIVFIQAPDAVWLDSSLWQRVWRLLRVVAAGGLSYFTILYLQGLRPHQMLLRER